MARCLDGQIKWSDEQMAKWPNSIRHCAALHSGAGLYDSVLGYDDHSISNEVAVSIRFIEPLLVHKAHPVTHACVLVDDHAIENDIAADSQARRVASCRRHAVG